MVITGLTRNQVAFTGSWVRIPPLPPEKRHCFCSAFYISFLYNSVFLFKEIVGCGRDYEICAFFNDFKGAFLYRFTFAVNIYRRRRFAYYTHFLTAHINRFGPAEMLASFVFVDKRCKFDSSEAFFNYYTVKMSVIGNSLRRTLVSST